MSTITFDEAMNILEKTEELTQMAVPIARDMLELETGSNQGISWEDITIEDGLLYANWSTSCCGDWDDHSTVIPLQYLFDSNWKKTAQEAVKRKREEAKEAERIRKEKAEKAKQERERKEYLKLKEKYEGKV